MIPRGWYVAVIKEESGCSAERDNSVASLTNVKLTLAVHT